MEKLTMVPMMDFLSDLDLLKFVLITFLIIIVEKKMFAKYPNNFASTNNLEHH